MSTPADDVVQRMIELFEEYAKDFGLADAEYPCENHQERACEFEEKFRELICEYRGHEIGPDQCGKPEHDFCYRCHKLRTEIEVTLGCFPGTKVRTGMRTTLTFADMIKAFFRQ